MQSNDDLYSTDINPVIASYLGYDKNRPGITSPGESDKDPREKMPVAGANETGTKEDEKKDSENAGDEQELAGSEGAGNTEDAGSGTMEDTAAQDTNDDTYYDASDVEGNATALNKNRSNNFADDTSGVY